MIQQPELGKKIADLRKAKNLTQEELVEKCNLNVRTLQRIESGEVTPRTYTIRLIFEALDFSIEKSQNGKGLLIKWLEQFYISFIDLFNLKTNIMKKITIVTILFSSITFGILALNTDSNAQINTSNSIKKSENKSIVFSNFYCKNCFEENDELIGHTISFKTNGVAIKLDLIKLNKTTHEFSAGFIKGKLLKNKVELICPKELVNDENVNFTAEDIVKSENKIVLKGKAELTTTLGDLIEANEIVILFN